MKTRHKQRQFASMLSSTLLLLALIGCGAGIHSSSPSSSSSGGANNGSNSGGATSGSSNAGNTGGSGSGTSGSSGGNSTGATYVYAGLYGNSGGVVGFSQGAGGTLSAVPGSPFSQPGSAPLAALAAFDGYVYTSNLVNETSAQPQLIQFKADAATGSLTEVGTSLASSGSISDSQMHRLLVNSTKKVMYGMFQWTIVSYALDANGTPTVINSTNPSTDSVFGFDFMPNGPYAYAEIQNGNPKQGFQQPQIMLLTMGSDGSVTTSRAVATLSSANLNGDLKIDPSGRYVAAVTGMNAGEIAVYAIASDGSLNEVAGSPFSTGTQFLSSLAFDSTGKFLYAASQQPQQPQPENLQVYSFDASSGKLSQIQNISEPDQQNFQWMLVDGNYLYLTNSQGATASTITVYNRDPNTGQLTQAAEGNASIGVGETAVLHF